MRSLSRKITAHYVRKLDHADITSERGIPCTTVGRTLLDLADVIDRHRLERALAQAEVLGIFDRNELEDVLERASGRRGSRTIARNPRRATGRHGSHRE